MGLKSSKNVADPDEARKIALTQVSRLLSSPEARDVFCKDLFDNVSDGNTITPAGLQTLTKLVVDSCFPRNKQCLQQLLDVLAPLPCSSADFGETSESAVGLSYDGFVWYAQSVLRIVDAELRSEASTKQVAESSSTSEPMHEPFEHLALESQTRASSPTVRSESPPPSFELAGEGQNIAESDDHRFLSRASTTTASSYVIGKSNSGDAAEVQVRKFIPTPLNLSPQDIQADASPHMQRISAENLDVEQADDSGNTKVESKVSFSPSLLSSSSQAVQVADAANPKLSSLSNQWTTYLSGRPGPAPYSPVAPDRAQQAVSTQRYSLTLPHASDMKVLPSSGDVSPSRIRDARAKSQSLRFMRVGASPVRGASTLRAHVPASGNASPLRQRAPEGLANPAVAHGNGVTILTSNMRSTPKPHSSTVPDGLSSIGKRLEKDTAPRCEGSTASPASSSNSQANSLRMIMMSGARMTATSSNVVVNAQPQTQASLCAPSAGRTVSPLRSPSQLMMWTSRVVPSTQQVHDDGGLPQSSLVSRAVPSRSQSPIRPVNERARMCLGSSTPLAMGYPVAAVERSTASLVTSPGGDERAGLRSTMLGSPSFDAQRDMRRMGLQETNASKNALASRMPQESEFRSSPYSHGRNEGRLEAAEAFEAALAASSFHAALAAAEAALCR